MLIDSNSNSNSNNENNVLKWLENGAPISTQLYIQRQTLRESHQKRFIRRFWIYLLIISLFWVLGFGFVLFCFESVS